MVLIARTSLIVAILTRLRLHKVLLIPPEFDVLEVEPIELKQNFLTTNTGLFKVV